MKRIIIYIFIIPYIILYTGIPLSAKISEDKILSMLEIALEKLPDKISEIPEKVKRISLYSIKVDKEEVSRSLFRQIQGKIESKFLEFNTPTLVYAPEVKPAKIVAKKDSITFISNFQTTEDIKDIAQKLRLDGFIEGEICVSSKKVYLNLRIFDADSMAVVWSQSIDSIKIDEEATPRTTGTDFGFGTAGLFLASTPETATAIPEFAKYYFMDIRLSQILVYETRIAMTLTGSFMYMYEGINSSRRTIVSGPNGKSSIGLITSVGLRIPIIPVKVKTKTKIKYPHSRDWLASDLKVGKIWAQKGYSANVYGIKMECDLTKNISISAGISYVQTQTLAYATDCTVKTGGLLYEVSLLRFNYRP